MCCFCYHEGHRFTLLVDRRFDIYVAPLHVRNTSLHQGTLLDAELVRTFDGGFKLLIFDMYYFTGVCLHQVSYPHRHRMAEAVLQLSGDPHLALKPIFEPWQWAALEQHLQTLDHPNDGLIFTPFRCALLTGRHPELFKWKRQRDNTVDCILAVADPEHVVANLNHLSTLSYWLLVSDDDKLVTWEQTEGPQEWLDDFMKRNDTSPDVIVECCFNGERWIPKQRRFDKHTPNTLFVANRTRQNIEENITVATLRTHFQRRLKSRLESSCLDAPS